MNATTIRRLCDALPPPEEDVVHDNYRQLKPELSVGISDPGLVRFLTAYKDLQFGWTFARRMALNRRPMPPFLQERDQWLWRAYLYNINPKQYRDATLQRALCYMEPSWAKERAVLNALLMAHDNDIHRISRQTGEDPAVITAYELLFFNILDRREDHMFISSIVYPEGRLVEMYQHYVESERLDLILLRAGYNNGALDVLYFAGFPSYLLTQFAGKDTPSRLEAIIMSNGYILARNGWLNQGAAAAGLHGAKALIAAAKQGGGDEAVSPFHDRGSGALLMGELTRIKSGQLRDRRLLMQPPPTMIIAAKADTGVSTGGASPKGQ